MIIIALIAGLIIFLFKKRRKSANGLEISK